LSENYKEINILILGSGNQEIEDQLNSLLDYKGNYNTFGYNEELTFNLCGADFFDAIRWSRVD
jgi:starch synthase